MGKISGENMKNLLVILGVFLISSAGVHAGTGPSYTCTGDTGEVLTISSGLITRADYVNVQATLAKDNEIQKLAGTFELGQNNYEMSDLDGQKVTLKINKVINHGGRCGRCEISVLTETFAKLTIGNEEYNFICK